MTDPIALRIAASRERALLRARSITARVPLVVAALRARGAHRVTLFGSLARGDAHERSDLDLCVEGLAAPLGAAALELQELAGARVDVVRREDASPGLLRRIDEEGIDVTG